MGVVCVMDNDLDSRSGWRVFDPWCKSMADLSIHSKCAVDGLKQRRVAERLEEALHGALFEQVLTDAPIFIGRNENDRNFEPAKRQFPLEIGSGHARHGDVEDQASGLDDAIGSKEFLRRRKRLGLIT
jgi:hypothetical protein